MKKYKKFSILTCMMCFFFITACEKTDHTTSKVAPNTQLTSRDGDGPCDNCDMDNCCCGFELTDVTIPTTFRVCGYDNGTTSCTPTPPSGCNTISGGFAQPTLSTGSSIKFAFCMLQGNCFQITNTTFGASGAIKISCDYDQTSPTFTFVSIPYNQTYTWCVDGNCGFEQCDP